VPTPLPSHFGDAAAEYAATRERAGLIDRRDWGVLEVTGRDRATFLHALLSNEIKALASGQGCAAALLDLHGKVQVVLLVWILDERILLVVPPGMARKVAEALDHYLFSEKAYFRDQSEETALLLLAGPDAHALVERLAGGRPGPAPWAHVGATVDGAPVRLVTGGAETGEPEVWVVAEAAQGSAARDRLVAAGARPIGLAALESLRIEAGTPLFGHDVDETVLLPEIPSANLVSHTKGCYPGQEVVVRIRDRGHVNRLLAGLVLEGDLVPERGSAVLAGDAEVGKVTSATHSFGLGRPIALAFVRRQHCEVGTAVTVRAGDRAIPARVSALPFDR